MQRYDVGPGREERYDLYIFPYHECSVKCTAIQLAHNGI